MTQFKAGDRVLTETAESQYSDLTGTVVESEEIDGYLVRLDKSPEPTEGPIFYHKDELTLVQEPQHEGVDWPLKEVAVDIGVAQNAIQEFARSVSKFARTDATDPSYYTFGDVEVRQISGYLTGFGAQALQYVARATRLDGQNKGDAVEDLKKSLRFIEWEIERLEAGK